MRKKSSSLWSPNEEIKKKSNLESFIKHLNKKKLFKYNRKFKNIWKWSVNNSEIFWSEIWDFTKIRGVKGKKIIKKNKVFRKNIFFPFSRLNYTENLLSKKNNDIALFFHSEKGIEKKIKWNELNIKVCKFSYFLKKINLKEKDRVAAYVPNSIETIISFLAVAKNGLVWSSCSPDFGAQGVIDRFIQIKPKVLITCDYYYYNGKKNKYFRKDSRNFKKNKIYQKSSCFSLFK